MTKLSLPLLEETLPLSLDREKIKEKENRGEDCIFSYLDSNRKLRRKKNRVEKSDEVYKNFFILFPREKIGEKIEL